MEAAIDAVADGLTVEQWAKLRGIGKSSAATLLGICKKQGLEPEYRRTGGSTKPVAIISGPCLEAMDGLLAEHLAGASVPRLQKKYAQPQEEKQIDGDELLKRLQVAKLAQETGIALSKEELQWVVGAKSSSKAFKSLPLQKVGTRYLIGNGDQMRLSESE